MKFREDQRLLLRLATNGMHKNDITLTCALFAGGESRRMGKDKAQVTFAGRPLWSHQLNTLCELKPERVLVSARVRPTWCASEVEVALDQIPSFGPLSGLVAVLKQMRTTHLLALAIDMPRMTVAHLRSLCMVAKRGMGVIPQSGDFPEPLCAIYPVETLAIAQHNLATKEFSLRTLTQNLLKQDGAFAYRLTDLERSLYCNVNEPEDLACLV